ncbi:MAG: ABC transporter permease subunit [SAR324 cluster bacterium]|nr:ABC transporter permease subunit [SAR324 cluster bacterium]MCZ6646606.1 ABC transporter permease subunit [SAR324 cluster bacterium]
MTELTQEQGKVQLISWRNPAVRSVVYQIVSVVLVGFAAYTIFQNTVANLTKRGIASGFSFLNIESGFAISEVMPVPMLEPGFVSFISSIFLGLIAAFVLHKWVTRKGKTVGGDYRLVLLTIFFIFVVPAITYLLTNHIFVTETYSEASSYGLGLVTGVFNTIKMSILGCILATIIGFFVGIARLSSNWLVAKLAETYVEIIRNIPVLLQIFFWYFAVIRTLPMVRESINFFDVFIINNRGIYLPDPTPLPGFHPFLIALFVACVGVYFRLRHVKAVQDLTGRQLPVLFPSIAILIVFPGLVWMGLGAPVELSYPKLTGFNFTGGLNPSPEYAAMLMGLSIYHGSQIAEIVRSGIQAVSTGQKEAARALGLRGGFVMRLVVIPQAMRVIIPPLTSQYLGVTKNSSLGVAIGFPELVSVGGTILNQSGQAIEIIGITMAVYLAASLMISVFMNWYNEKMKLVER